MRAVRALEMSGPEPSELSPAEEAEHDQQVAQADAEHAARQRARAGPGGAVLLVPLTASQAEAIRRAADAAKVAYETYVANAAYQAALAVTRGDERAA